ncbi:hypothetical protein [Flavobacterium cerinum]|uniref:Lipoprotein n=1 Tax=Flavobacterium cerinum TaxID=2502784 RepID=A0ABY5IQU7_9FLAO|nr:hypothetical protein [Flavobacterium cerinum]UUC44572.1 hypothetical protein NOX80_13130 [Flavobacterium cerinum]
MNLIRNIILAFFLFLFLSCENFYMSSIINDAANPIVVKVKMDKIAIAKQRREYIKKGFLVSDEEPKDYEVKINPAESYEFEGRLHSRPDFYDIKEIEIYSGDTLILKCRKDQLLKLFSTETSPGCFDLIIK